MTNRYQIKYLHNSTFVCERTRIVNPETVKHNIAEFAKTVDPAETDHNEQSHLDLQSLHSSL